MTNSRLILFLFGIVLSCAFLISCQGGSNPVMPQQSTGSSMSQMAMPANTMTASSPASAQQAPSGAHGSFTEMPAYYDAKLFTINFQELPPKAEQRALTNPQLNFIYQCDACEGTITFISVIDAIPGDGMNPLWNEIQITFNSGFTPRQLFSDDEIAAAKQAGEITLTPTSEVYTCSVVGAK